MRIRPAPGPKPPAHAGAHTAASERNAARLEAEVATHGYFAAPGKPASLEARFTPVPASKLASLEAPAPARRSFRLSHQA